LLVDCSGSQQFGTLRQQKREVAAELAAVLAFSAVSNNDKIGLIAFTDRVERFFPPRKGARHVLRLIREVLYYQPTHPGTSIRVALDFLNRIQHRRAIVFLLSDFLDQGYERSLKRAARFHDLIAIRLVDLREEAMPPVGLLNLEDAETGQVMLIDTRNAKFRASFAAAARRRREECQQLLRVAQADLVEVTTDGNHLDALVRFFQRREQRLRRV
jgi:uncharacterized protein (DUF58 family)